MRRAVPYLDVSASKRSQILEGGANRFPAASGEQTALLVDDSIGGG